MAITFAPMIDPKDFREKCSLHAKNLAFISLEEASAITKEYGRGYRVRTLYQEKYEGALEVKKFGRRVYVSWSSLLAFLERKMR